MDYKQLNQTYRDDTLANAMYAREIEYFHYDFDKGNFGALLETLTDEARITDVKDRMAATVYQMEYVEAIYNALAAQVSDPAAHAAAIVRTAEKREKANVSAK